MNRPIRFLAFAAVSVGLWACLCTAARAQDHESRVTVLVDGIPAEKIAVRLVFVDGMYGSSSGRALTTEYKTGADGKVAIGHSAIGNAHVLVQGEWSCHGTEGPAPGNFVVKLSSKIPRQARLLDKWQHAPKDSASETNAPPTEKSVGVIGPTKGYATNQNALAEQQ